MSFKQALGEEAYDKLASIAAREYRTVQQQIDFMLAKLYGDTPAPAPTKALLDLMVTKPLKERAPVIASANKPVIVVGELDRITLARRTTSIYHHMTTACSLAIKGSPITALNVTKARYNGKISSGAISRSSTVLSNLMRNGYLGAVEGSWPRVYVVTAKGKQIMRKDPALQAIAFLPREKEQAVAAA